MSLRMPMLVAALLTACGSGPAMPIPTVTGCVQSVAAQGTQCALRDDGTVVCWGMANRGRVGDGSFREELVPPTRALIDRVTTLASGEDTTCAIRDDATAACWGAGTTGQIGDGGGVDRATPRDLPFGDVVEMAVAQTHACARLGSGQGFCWGQNSFGALGSPPSAAVLTPIAAPVGDATAIAASDDVTCAVRPDQHLDCWGVNDNGELGDGTRSSRSTPAPVAIPDPIVSVAGGCHHHSCALSSLGDVWCWGDNQWGQLGRDSFTRSEPQPAKVAGIVDAVEIGVGARHTCARTRDQRVWCWGANEEGQLGDGTFDTRATPALANTTDPITMVQASCAGTFALRDDGVVLAWGDYGGLGTGELLNRAVPGPVPIPCE